MATSTIKAEYIVKDFSVTTSPNANVSPWGAYALVDTPMSGYRLISAELFGTGSVNSSTSRIPNDTTSNQQVYVWSKSEGAFTLRCLYQKVGGVIRNFLKALQTLSFRTERGWA